MTTQRTTNRYLPDSKELSAIMAVEAQREAPPEHADQHFADLTTTIQLFEHFGLDSSVFTEDLDKGIVAEQGSAQVEQLTKTILAHQLGSEDIALLDAFYGYLSEEDKPVGADAIFVFGAKTPLRAEKAIELYQAGQAPLIIFSGGNPFYVAEGIQETEAERYAEMALAAEVPQEAILVEPKSITIPDNVRTTLNLLDALQKPVKSFLVVNSPYTQRRGWIHFKKYLPSDTRIMRVNCGTGPAFSRENWYRNEDGLRVVLNEPVKMRIATVTNTA